MIPEEGITSPGAFIQAGAFGLLSLIVIFALWAFYHWVPRITLALEGIRAGVERIERATVAKEGKNE